jgi:hypothetical protein
LQAGGAASVAAGKQVLPEGTRQTGSGKAGQGQRSESEGGGPCRRGHGRLSLSVCHVSIRQCRRQGRAGRCQKEFVFGRQRYHGEGIS